MKLQRILFLLCLTGLDLLSSQDAKINQGAPHAKYIDPMNSVLIPSTNSAFQKVSNTAPSTSDDKVAPKFKKIVKTEYKGRIVRVHYDDGTFKDLD